MDRSVTLLEVGALPGWEADDHAAALRLFRAGADRLAGPAWAAVVAEARGIEEGRARAFFERAFRALRIGDGRPALFTGYYEPEIDGALAPDAAFPVPLYRLPPAPPDGRWPSRAEIEAGALAGRGLEIAWVADPVDAFFLQVQGSGRLRLPGGRVLRLGYAGRNGHPYASVGQALATRGALPAGAASAEEVKSWLRARPEEGAAVMRLNASFVFFRELADVAPGEGPLGTLGLPVTPLRSVAVDPAHVPLGAPVWIETDGAAALRRLMVAQDTGSAILGPQRADVYFGTGAAAGERAGRLREGGAMAVLLPPALAEARAGTGRP